MAEDASSSRWSENKLSKSALPSLLVKPEGGSQRSILAPELKLKLDLNTSIIAIRGTQSTYLFISLLYSSEYLDLWHHLAKYHLPLSYPTTVPPSALFSILTPVRIPASRANANLPQANPRPYHTIQATRLPPDGTSHQPQHITLASTTISGLPLTPHMTALSSAIQARPQDQDPKANVHLGTDTTPPASQASRIRRHKT